MFGSIPWHITTQAVAAIESAAVTAHVEALPDQKLRRVFNQAWELLYTEHLYHELANQGGRPESDRKALGDLAELGTAFAAYVVAEKRGMKPSSRVTAKVDRKFRTMAVEFVARRSGKLSHIEDFAKG